MRKVTGFDSAIKSVKWDCFFKMVDHIGDDLNSKKNRFDKADILEHSLDLMTGGKIKWVDEVGWDHEIGKSHPIKLEMKSQKFCLKTKKGKYKTKVNDIKLMNSLGSALGRKVSDIRKFDVLLIVDTGNCESYSVASIDASQITKRYLDFKTDGVILKGFPIDKVKFIHEHEYFSSSIIEDSSYSVDKRNMQKKFIERFI